MSKFIKLAVYLFAILFIFSCSKKNTLTNPYRSNEALYATEEELKNIYEKSDKALYWKMAKFIAYEDFFSMEYEYGWQNASLSKTPIVIYDVYSNPLYYEYRVIKNGKEIGAVTANVLPSGAPVAYILSSIKDYTKALDLGLKVIDNSYPSVAFGVIGKPGDLVSSLIDSKGNKVDPQKTYDIVDMVKILGADEVAKIMGQTRSEIVGEYQVRNAELIQIEQDFRLMNEAIENVENISEEEMKSIAMPILTRSTVTFDYKIKYYRDKDVRRSYFDFQCGPSALAWIYYGIYRNYKGRNFNFSETGERIDDLILRKDERDSTYLVTDLIEASLTTKSGITWPKNLSRGLLIVTSNDYSVYGSLRFGRAFDYMKTAELPLISLRASRLIKIFTEWDWAWHYRVIYGVREEKYNHKFLWIKWSTYKKKLYMHDNSSDGIDFVENLVNFDIARYPVKFMDESSSITGTGLPCYMCKDSSKLLQLICIQKRGAHDAPPSIK